MTDKRVGSAQSYIRSKSSGPLARSKSAVPSFRRKFKQQPILVLYVDEDCPLHGTNGKCTCASFVNTKTNDETANSESLSTNIQPFDNNPSFPNTQRDIIGNNLQFNSSSFNDAIDDENNQLAALLQYRDSIRRNIANQAKFTGGFPRMRHGRVGSQWRHIKQTNTYSGSNLMFIDGTVRIDDSLKYPIPRFGYPPMKRPQHRFSASYNDLPNLTTKSFDVNTWSKATDALNQHPSISQHSNRFQRQAKDNHAYWPVDSTQQNKPRSNYSNSDYEVNQPVQERTKHGSD